MLKGALDVWLDIFFILITNVNVFSRNNFQLPEIIYFILTGNQQALVNASEVMIDKVGKCNNVWLDLKNPFMLHKKTALVCFFDLYVKRLTVSSIGLNQKQLGIVPWKAGLILLYT